nr:MAG TPA: hypothetical protein [Caudoviricetes sp.]
MADAKATLELTVNDKQLQALNEELAEGQQRVAMYKASLKDLEKATDNGAKATKEQLDSMVRLRQVINEQTGQNKRLSDAIKATTNEMNKQSQAAGALAGQKTGVGALFEGMRQGMLDAANNAGVFGQKIGELSELMSSATLTGAAVATSIMAIGAGLTAAGREVSAYANQFIAYTKNMNDATEMYNKFNEVYRNTNYDEQKVYDMAKGFLNVGKSANEAADLIMICADASAKLGGGVETAEMLEDCFKRLATGGELTERQYKALAEADIDLSDVQDEMRAGGETAYEALKAKLEEYRGGMAGAKTTAAEMEGDIKGNLIEIGRQTALLVDEFFGFSEKLREFYQWVIDTSQKVIDSIKAMIKSFRNAKASAEEYRLAMEAYGEIDENDMEAVAKRAMYVDQQCRAMKAEREEAEKLNDVLNQAPREHVQSIAKTNGSTGGSTGGRTSSAKTAKVDNGYANAYRELLASQKASYDQEVKKNALMNKQTQILQEQSLIGLSDSERRKKQAEYDQQNYETQKAQEEALAAKRQQNYEALTEYLQGHPFDGSDKILENLATQYQNEEELWAMRLKNQEALNNLKIAQNNDVDAEEIRKNIETEKQLWQNYGKSVAGSIGEAVAAVVNGQKTIGQALKDVAKQIISNALNMMAQWLALVAILAAFRAPHPGRIASYMMFGGFNSAKLTDGDKDFIGLRTGGYISGAGTSTSDSIPAMLSDGEYVLNAQSVDAIGVDNLNRINAARSNADVAISGAGGGNKSLTLNVSALDASSFTDFLSRGGMQILKQAMLDDDRNFNTAFGTF